MADRVPPHPGSDMTARSETGGQAPPPPLNDIRVKGRTAKGLNKPAILAAIGGGVAVILVLASNGLTSDPSLKPAETKPMMSDPARPEMAQGAVRELPATYAQAAAREAALLPAQTPLPVPVMPGEAAASWADLPEPPATQIKDGFGPPSGYSTDPPLDPALEEDKLAERAGLFFSLRQEPLPAVAQNPQQSPPPAPLTALVRQPVDQTAAPSGANRALFPGAVIPASLITGINSESPGPVIAQVTQTIYDSATGRIALIPQGARLIGDYKSSTRYGQSRIAILWSRIIVPNGDEIALDEAAIDPSGAAGVSGKVDNHWGEVFGAATLGTLINIGVAATEDPQLTYSGVGVIVRDPVDQAINEGVQRSANIVTNRVVDRSLAIPPTIRVEAGKRISVIVTRRMRL